jgi:hypothetical protein
VGVNGGIEVVGRGTDVAGVVPAGRAVGADGRRVVGADGRRVEIGGVPGSGAGPGAPAEGAGVAAGRAVGADGRRVEIGGVGRGAPPSRSALVTAWRRGSSAPGMAIVSDAVTSAAGTANAY